MVDIYHYKLTHASISRNSLSSLPKGISNLKNLHTLFINSNYFKKIPAVFSENSSIIKLNLSSNSLVQQHIPPYAAIPRNQRASKKDITVDDIFESFLITESLRYLDISSSHINDPNIIDFIVKAFPNLELLNLSKGRLISLPQSLSQLSKLEVLQINNTTSIANGTLKVETLPSNIGDLSNLRELHLGGNEINELPESFGNLKKLRILDLSYNGIKSISTEICNLENLKVLKLSSRPFTQSIKLISIPQEIVELTNLEELHLNGNLCLGGLSSLRLLDLRRNSFKYIPESLSKLQNLEILRLNQNSLKDLPLALSDLPKLKSFEYDISTLSENSLFKHYGLAQISRILQIKEREKIKVGLLKLPDILRTAFQRYFVAFDEFWRDVTGQEINFKVNKHTEGLEIEVELSGNISREDVEERLNQYFSLLTIKKQDFANYIQGLVTENKDLNEKVIRAEVRVSQLEQDIKIVELQNKHLAQSVRNLLSNLQGSKVDIIRLESENKTLREFKSDYVELLKVALPSPQVNVSQIQKVEQNLTVSIQIDLYSIQDNFSDIIEHLPKELKTSGEQIRDSLDPKGDLDSAKNDTSFKTKFRRFFKDLSKVDNLKKWIENINSLGESAPKAYENIKKSLQSLLDFSDSISLPEAAEYIKKLLDNI